MIITKQHKSRYSPRTLAESLGPIGEQNVTYSAGKSADGTPWGTFSVQIENSDSHIYSAKLTLAEAPVLIEALQAFVKASRQKSG